MTLSGRHRHRHRQPGGGATGRGGRRSVDHALDGLGDRGTADADSHPDNGRLPERVQLDADRLVTGVS
jgi:hypothetical protein